VRCRLDYTQTDDYKGGSRFFLSYSGSAPTAGNCATLASDIATQWASDLAPLMGSDWVLTEVDVLDIATDSGSSGQWTGSESGSRSGMAFAAQVATNIEYDIARRYRGGKPRMFLPPGVADDAADLSHWSTDFISEVNSAIATFFTAINALDIGAMGTLQHVSLSYYESFTNVTNSSGRTRAAPKYRTPAALVDTVNGYATKGQFGSQKRRRAASSY